MWQVARAGSIILNKLVQLFPPLPVSIKGFTKDFPNRLTIEKINKISILDKHQQTCDGASSPVGQTTATLQNQPGPFFKKI